MISIVYLYHCFQDDCSIPEDAICFPLYGYSRREVRILQNILQPVHNFLSSDKHSQESLTRHAVRDEDLNFVPDRLLSVYKKQLNQPTPLPENSPQEYDMPQLYRELNSVL